MKKTCRVLALMLLIALSAAGGGRAAAATLTVYGNSLSAGWQDWSWSSTRNFSNKSPVYSGNTYSLAVTYTGGYGGLYLAAVPPIASSPYDTLQFCINGGTQGGQNLAVYLTDNAQNFLGQGVAVQVIAGKWTQVTIPLSALRSPSWIGGIVLMDTTNGAEPTFYLDDMCFINQGIPPLPTLPGPALSINVSASTQHPISPYIYGINYADEFLASALNLPVCRWGGNSTTRYNWQANISNHASDWYFENIPNGPDVTDGSASDLFIEQNILTRTKTLMTVPLIGWTPKSDSPRSQPYDCGFEVSLYGAQQSTDSQYDPNCGNGILVSGADITGNSPTDTSTQIGPSFVTAWVNYLVGKYGTASAGGVDYYDLDNEPMLWNSTHRDVHPIPTSYDEMKTLTYQYAAAVKAADPTASTLGPVLWGWCAYFYSALDGCAAGKDYTSHGSEYFVPWYLQQMNAYEQTNGVRILDFLDLHYYPAATGVALSPAGDSSTQALRLRSTRSLWDPTYIDESWIGGMTPGGAVNLIPRMKAWVAANYPGTKLSISEYNWGALNDINGALAQADVLGIFGSEGLDLATLWGPPADTDPGAFAFRMYRNYDGAKHAFGDVSTLAASTDQGTLAVYAAQRTADNALTVMVINKVANPLTSTVTLAGYTPVSNAAVYQYSPANVAAIVQLADQAVSSTGFSATFPGNSIKLFVMTKASVQQTGSLKVTITPSSAVSAGAMWSVNGGSSWNASGTTVAGLAAGSCTLTFKPVAGWTTPASQSVTITNGGAATATGVYVQQTGSIKVTISPSGAVTAGAEWSVNGGSSWNASGTTVAGLPAGIYTVTFKPVTGWTTPASQSVTITNGGAATATGVYVQQTGSLKVTISPSGAVSAGAMWSVNGGSSWNASGATVAGLAPGSCTLTFKPVAGWTTPASQSVTITNGGAATASGAYVQQTGSIKARRTRNFSPFR